MAITRDEVAHLARLARLAVTDDELELFAGQLDVILGAVARVGEVAAHVRDLAVRRFPTVEPDHGHPVARQELRERAAHPRGGAGDDEDGAHGIGQRRRRPTRHGQVMVDATSGPDG